MTLQEKLIYLQEWCVKNSQYEIRWFMELFFNIGYENKIEWGLGLSRGYSRDYIFEGHNYFGDTPEEAIDKAMRELKLFQGRNQKSKSFFQIQRKNEKNNQCFQYD